MATRSPICTVVGHVDHGKSSVLDWVRGTSVVSGEAGAITQAIGASIVPLQVLKEKCGAMLDALKLDFTIPGLLFIDTPGHAAFTSLRKRGGNLADIAILVVDINEGFKPQTFEAIEILRDYKTPFIIAANKIDLIGGYRSGERVLGNIGKQDPKIITEVETKLYELVAKVHETVGMDAERFDRVSDYTKQIAIVPCSAKTGEGLPELLMVLAGLAQKYLEDSLKIEIKGDGKGTVLEVKETKGLGMTIDAILYDGSLKVNDTIVIGGLDKPIVTKVKALFEPEQMAEMREKRAKFNSVKEVNAAIGVRISASDVNEVISGMPLRSCSSSEVESVKQEVQKEVNEVVIETSDQGIVVKADSLGSLEALLLILKDKGIPVSRASIGEISKKDLADAEANKDPLQAVVLGFNVSSEGAGRAKVIVNNVIYKLIEEFEKWQEDEKKRQEGKALDLLIRPCKIQLMKNYIFRQSGPAVIGVEVLNGKLKSGTPLMKDDGKVLTEVKSMQAEQETVSEAEEGKQVAVSMDKVTVGRQIKGDEILYSAIPEDDFRKMKKLKQYLTPKEVVAIKEISEIMRKDNPVWGV
ncbi:translation initiation factor IF-2 [Nanoarchaeota archaeon]